MIDSESGCFQFVLSCVATLPSVSGLGTRGPSCEGQGETRDSSVKGQVPKHRLARRGRNDCIVEAGSETSIGRRPLSPVQGAPQTTRSRPPLSTVLATGPTLSSPLFVTGRSGARCPSVCLCSAPCAPQGVGAACLRPEMCRRPPNV